jgi:hypothetical protein
VSFEESKPRLLKSSLSLMPSVTFSFEASTTPFCCNKQMHYMHSIGCLRFGASYTKKK